jgi:hypothetical protein
MKPFSNQFTNPSIDSYYFIYSRYLLIYYFIYIFLFTCFNVLNLKYFQNRTCELVELDRKGLGFYEKAARTMVGLRDKNFDFERGVERVKKDQRGTHS